MIGSVPARRSTSCLTLFIHGFGWGVGIGWCHRDANICTDAYFVWSSCCVTAATCPSTRGPSSTARAGASGGHGLEVGSILAIGIPSAITNHAERRHRHDQPVPAPYWYRRGYARWALALKVTAIAVLVSWDPRSAHSR